MLGNLVYQNFADGPAVRRAPSPCCRSLIMASYLLTIRRTGALDNL